VYFEDTDAGGVVYHATYLRYAERARTEFLRAAGVPHHELMTGEGLVFVVRSAAVEYLRPARLDDSLLVVTRVAGLGRASVMLDQLVRAGDATLASMRIGLVCTDLAAGKARKIPARWRDMFAALLDGEEGAGTKAPRKEF
jgi:acyl-CoA thioester hydrolase